MLFVVSGLAGLVLGVGDRQRTQKDWPLRDGEKRHASPHRALSEAGRGRRASSPTTIPAKGWTDVLWRTYRPIQADHLLAIFGPFADPARMQSHVEQAKAILPCGAADIVSLMVWMWVSAIVILAGVELNAEIEHRTLRDTTYGLASHWACVAPRWPTRSARAPIDGR